MKLRYSALHVALALALATPAAFAADGPQAAPAQNTPAQGGTAPDKKVKQLDAMAADLKIQPLGARAG